ncbi:hypothetical protein GOBAR_AA13921 [Gossypium barbadense]|uniref:Uncharacterized protein n=1 Tax=Gossypium barbadense TaxID=3634 RepID=A0A2P5XTP0_GOSBA|nr:hypothetical protein GOBAR_AA13921 [Gossypium barbadense]
MFEEVGRVGEAFPPCQDDCMIIISNAGVDGSSTALSHRKHSLLLTRSRNCVNPFHFNQLIAEDTGFSANQACIPGQYVYLNCDEYGKTILFRSRRGLNSQQIDNDRDAAEYVSGSWTDESEWVSVVKSKNRRAQEKGSRACRGACREEEVDWRQQCLKTAEEKDQYKAFSGMRKLAKPISVLCCSIQRSENLGMSPKGVFLLSSFLPNLHQKERQN